MPIYVLFLNISKEDLLDLVRRCTKRNAPCSVLKLDSFYDNKKEKFRRLKVEEQSLLAGNL